MGSGCFASNLNGQSTAAVAFPTSVLQHSLRFLYIFSCQFLQASPGLFVNNEWKHEITPPAPKMKQNWLAMCFFFFFSVCFLMRCKSLSWCGGKCLQTAVSVFPWGKRNNNKKKAKSRKHINRCCVRSPNKKVCDPVAEQNNL